MSFQSRSFWNRSNEQKHELQQILKDKKSFKNWAPTFEKEKSEERKEYERMKSKIATFQESRRNMKIDMRPKVLARTMTKELLILAFGLTMIVGMPLYFYKVKPAIEARSEQAEQMLIRRRDEQESLHQQQLRQYSQNNYKSDWTMSTEQKMARFTKEERDEQIRKMEEDYEREVLRSKRQERLNKRKQQSEL